METPVKAKKKSQLEELEDRYELEQERLEQRMASLRVTAKGGAGGEEEETVFDDIEMDAFDDSVSRADQSAMLSLIDNLKIREGKDVEIDPSLRIKSAQVMIDPDVQEGYKTIIRQVGSKKGDILKFLQQNDEWVSEANTKKNWTKASLEAELKLFVADRLESGQEVIFEGRVHGVSEETVKSPEVQKRVQELKSEGVTTKDKKIAFIQRTTGKTFSARGLNMHEIEDQFQKAVALYMTKDETATDESVAQRVNELQKKIDALKDK